MQERTCDGKALAVEWYKRGTEEDGGILRHDYVLLRYLLPQIFEVASDGCVDGEEGVEPITHVFANATAIETATDAPSFPGSQKGFATRSGQEPPRVPVLSDSSLISVSDAKCSGIKLWVFSALLMGQFASQFYPGWR